MYIIHNNITDVFPADRGRAANERVRQGGLAVVHVRDDAHGSDVVRLVHDLPHLIHGEVRHLSQRTTQRTSTKEPTTPASS